MRTKTTELLEAVAKRKIIARTSGSAHGPIVRLVSTSDLGELIKPFVFLDIFELNSRNDFNFGFHPHSGISTVSVILDGRATYEETTGAAGIIETDGVEYMQAGGGVWHSGHAVTDYLRGFQLWIALPPDQENSPNKSHYLLPSDVFSEGPARVILGQYGQARSQIASPVGINYLDVRLKAGERWNYTPPAGHQVAWLAVYKGRLHTSELVAEKELVVFEESEGALFFEAKTETSFMLGSAVKHPHDLVLGHYSVHTNEKALVKGELEISRIGKDLHLAKKLA